MVSLIEYDTTNGEVRPTGTTLTFSGNPEDIVQKLSYTLNLKKKTRCVMGESGRIILCGNRAYFIKWD